MPWSTRAAMSTGTFGARAHATDAIVNHAVPTMKRRRRPNRSPSAPPTRISAARLNV